MNRTDGYAEFFPLFDKNIKHICLTFVQQFFLQTFSRKRRRRRREKKCDEAMTSTIYIHSDSRDSCVFFFLLLLRSHSRIREGNFKWCQTSVDIHAEEKLPPP